MKKRNVIRIISYALAFSLVGFGFFAKERQVSNQYKIMVENEYVRSLKSLSESVNNITETLNKAVYVKDGNDMLSMSTKLFAEGEIAKDSLSNLPGGDKDSGYLYKFLSQVGNYAMSISKTAQEDGEIGDEDVNKLMSLFETSKKIKTVIDETESSYDNLEDFAKLVDKKIENSVDIKTLAVSLDDLEEDLSDYPTLIYDGPYSDHILNKEPLMVKNEKTYTKEECRKKAEKTFGLDNNSLEFDGVQSGKIECYRFKNDNITVSVSKQGCYIVYMRKNRTVNDIKITNNTAVDYAKEFMSGLNVDNMVENYYYSDEGVCTINFAYLDGQTFCYTDLIKVGVALDNGEIMLIETSGYLTNHTARTFEVASFSEEQAREKISKLLTIKSSNIALIPTDSGKEVRCYEFNCSTKDGQEILVYIDIRNLDTKDVLILQKSDAGTLVK